MFGKKALIVSLAGLLLCSSGGCSLFVEDMYSAVTPYTVSPISEGSGIIAIENYRELVNALLHFVSGHETTGQIRLNNYQREEAQLDLAEAVEEILTETAMGSYAVDQIHWDLQSIMSNLEVEVTIDYRKTQEEYREIVPANGSSAILRNVSDSMLDYRESLVIQNLWSSNNRSQISDLIHQATVNSVSHLVEIPQIYVTFYPKEGPWWIVELNFHYLRSTEQLLERQEALTEEISKISSRIWTEVTGDMHQSLLLELNSRAKFASLGSTPYDVLLSGKGNSQGFAWSYLALCQEMLLDCVVVEGTYLGEEFSWNQITLDSGTVHFVDATKGLPEDGVFPYYSDQEMSDMGYQWTVANYGVSVPYEPHEPEEVLEETAS